MPKTTPQPKARDLKPGDFIAWPSHEGVQVHRVQRVHPNGHVLRDEFGYMDQFDCLPRRWRMATDVEVAEYRGGLAS